MMTKLTNPKSALRIFFTMVVFISSALPLQAATKTNFLTPEKQIIRKDGNRQLLALSWGDIWRELRRKKGQKGSRSPKQPTLCMITPGKLQDPDDKKETLLVWGTKPVFLWQGEIKGIEVRHIRSNKLMWSENLESKTNSIVYQGKTLEPGQAYSWGETEPLSEKDIPNKQSFRIMKTEERDRISEELKQLESKLKAKGVKGEKIVLARIEYFADKKLWSDVFREMYAVENPSPELKAQIEQIESHDFCTPDKDGNKVSLVSGD